ncbi:hypothetical protein ACK8HY_15190 [Sphingobacterium sp. NGMCC 1.201703]|uniref:hypothetical protein n=1 Tax=Sphingobacterium sp. NGMCC 1.201703 TaxID=3388657 RepID=UPI0039FC987A
MKEIDKDAVQYMELAYNIPEVNLQDLNIYYNFEKYLDKGIKVLGFEVKRIIPYQTIVNGVPIPHDDCNIQKRLTILYYDKTYDELSDDEKARIDYILEDMTVIAHCYVEMNGKIFIATSITTITFLKTIVTNQRSII